MAWHGRVRLGLAFGERRILAAEIRLNGRPRVRAVADVEFDSIESLDDAAVMGKALRQALKASNIRARHVMLGLPAKWLMTRVYPVPPADPQALRDMLRLGADRVFTVDAEQLMMDYVPPNASLGGAVLMVAATRQNAQRAIKIAEAAGLRVDGVTSSTAALATMLENDAAVLRCDDESGELAVRREGQLAALVHVGRGRDLAGNLKRLIAGEPQLAEAVRRSAVHVTAWDHATGQSQRELGDAIGTAVESLKLPHVNGLDDVDTVQRYAPAIAAALAGADAKYRPVDLINSRLAEPHRPNVVIRWRAAIIAAVIALLALGAMGLSIYREKNELAEMTAQLAAGQPNAEAAKLTVDRVRQAEQWLRHRPRAMEMLREMTLAFPERGTVWLNELTIREDHSAVLSGKAEQDRGVLELRDKLAKSDGISQVKLLFMREAGKSERQINFAISLHLDRNTVIAGDEPVEKPQPTEVSHAE
ncbi:hypothetical protein HED60_24025 [Planctomycetales bacterium ZRK34]|nr:hypothetical protein HED60_24025 [Planctomycetales bacterium ZRK34]